MEQQLSATIWMGEITPEMDKAFITEAFANMGFTVIDVKEMFNKSTGERGKYCFVDFGDVNLARKILIEVNDEPIPGTEGKKFKLNRSEYGRSNPNKETEFSMFVGDLSPDVTDNRLLDFFRAKYPSAKAANIVKDELGNPKGFGFVRFFDEEEHTKALLEMQGAKGLGKRQIRVNRANRSKHQSGNAGPPSQVPGGGWGDQVDSAQMPQWMQMQMQYMQQMQQYMQQCHQYAQQAAQYAGWKEGDQADGDKPSHKQLQLRHGSESSSNSNIADNVSTFMSSVEQEHAQMLSQTAEVEEDQELVDPDEEADVDVAALNREIIDRDDKLFFELEASRWNFQFSFLDANQQRLVKTR